MSSQFDKEYEDLYRWRQTSNNTHLSTLQIYGEKNQQYQEEKEEWIEFGKRKENEALRVEATKSILRNEEQTLYKKKEQLTLIKKELEDDIRQRSILNSIPKAYRRRGDGFTHPR